MGLSKTPNSLQTQFTLTNATPIFGLIVVNGKLAIGIDESVAALKNVDLPTFALPNKPIINSKILANNGIYIYVSILSKMIREQEMEKYQNFYRSNDKAILNFNGWNSCSMRTG
jgi:hypothetical protein